ncbi:BBS1 protein, partial [Drymodes brunneopygia]|nr:BBS1 protein [Drymodes brunneopygia]
CPLSVPSVSPPMSPDVPHVPQTVVTCLGALPRGGPEGTPECPVLGTEAGDVLVLDPEAFTVTCKVGPPKIP